MQFSPDAGLTIQGNTNTVQYSVVGDTPNMEYSVVGPKTNTSQVSQHIFELSLSLRHKLVSQHHNIILYLIATSHIKL